MTDIEALLSVDAGRVPEGTVAFFMRDLEVEQRHRRLAVGILFACAAAVCAFCRTGRASVALLGLAAGIFAVLSTPTASESDCIQQIKRSVVVVTPTGIVIRDSRGLRTLMFTDFLEASSWRHADRVDLLLVRHDGSRVFINCQGFHRGERLPDVVKQRLQALTA
jgi:hypothetical protein